MMVEIEHMKEEYDDMITNLLGWIEEKIVHLSDRNFPNTLTGSYATIDEWLQEILDCGKATKVRN